MKNIKTILPALICAFTVLASCNNKPATEETTTTTSSPSAEETTYHVNKDNTSLVTWKGVMLGVKEHTGTLSFEEGTISTKAGQLTGGNLTIDLSTIATTDTNYNEKAGYGSAKLISHLLSPDFFDAAKFPTSSFVVNSVAGNTAKGTLTIRGKSNEETLNNIVITESEGTVKASGQLKFDRKKYDVKFDMPVKDMVISNDVELNIELTGKK